MNYRQWKKGNDTSLLFYENKLPYKARQFNHVFPLPNYFAEMIGDKVFVSIADLGAGMFSTTGNIWPTAMVDLYPSDILADEYNALLSEHKVSPLIPVTKQDMTALTYADESFDIVNCVNALDHCFDPLLALNEMYRVCKAGGWIHLRHFANNAEYQQYHGAHMWNICKMGDDCRFWNREREFFLSKHFIGFKTHEEASDTEPKILVVSLLRK